MTRSRSEAAAASERRLALLFALPALLCVLAVAVFPVLWTFWESLHQDDLRLPWLGRSFVGLANYREAAGDARFWGALAHTFFFSAVSVAAELALGLALALLLHQAFRGRGIARTLALLPWALPTVVAALLWRFLFEGPGSLANSAVVGLGLADEPLAWLADARLAWVPILAADVWKTTPFVALLLLAGLQGVDDELREAARVDGASARQEFVHVVWPALRPVLLVALVFRSLDAFRVFDLIYVLTGGGPGTATEPLSLYAFATLQKLRFGYGCALAVCVFAVSFVLATVYVRLLGFGSPRENA